MKLLSVTILLSFPLFFSCSAKLPHVNVGDAVPLFTLMDQNGKNFNISDYVGKKILVIYFYPKDESGVCTKEACAFRDSYADFTDAGAMVIGINYASVETHKSFIQNHNLPFTLLSDPGNKVLKMFGVKSKIIVTGRETFVVDLAGKVAYQYNAFTEGKEHADETLKFIKNMKNNK